MKIKCSLDEYWWLVEHLGEEIADNYPWFAGIDSTEDIASAIDRLIDAEGLKPNGGFNAFGYECYHMSERLCEKNGGLRKRRKSKIVCSEEERQWLIEYLGKEIADNYPWRTEPWSDKCVESALDDLMWREGFNDPNEWNLNRFGHECENMERSLSRQNR